MNRTDQYSDTDIEQGIRNFKGVAKLCRLMRGSLNPADPMRHHLLKVIEFCDKQAKDARKLLVNRKIVIAS